MAEPSRALLTPPHPSAPAASQAAPSGADPEPGVEAEPVRGHLLVVMAKGLGRLDGLYRELGGLGWRVTVSELDEPLLRWASRAVGIRPSVAAYRRAALRASTRLTRTALAFGYRTRRSRRLLRDACGRVDCVLQIGGMWAPAPRPSTPYALFCDCTVRLGDGNPLSGVDFPSRAVAERWYRLEGELYRGAVAIFTASDYARRSVIEDYGAAPERVTTVGYGINLQAPDDIDHPYDGRTLLFVGYEFERKGGPMLLEAFARVREALPKAQLLIAGPRRRPEALPEGVNWLGTVGREELARLYERASLFVMPSLFEPFGLVYLEAMEWKVPCVGTAACAMPEIVLDGETGRLVPPDAGALAEALIDLLRRPDRLREMGERGRRYVRGRFPWPQVAARVDHELRRALAARRAHDEQGS